MNGFLHGRERSRLLARSSTHCASSAKEILAGLRADAYGLWARGRTRQFMLSGKWDASRQLPAFRAAGLAGILRFQAAGRSEGVLRNVAGPWRRVPGLSQSTGNSTASRCGCLDRSLCSASLRGRTDRRISRSRASNARGRGARLSLGTEVPDSGPCNVRLGHGQPRPKADMRWRFLMAASKYEGTTGKALLPSAVISSTILRRETRSFQLG